MSHESKRYKQAIKVADLSKSYSLEAAMEHIHAMPAAKFDETLELSFHLGVDPKQSDQMIRGTVSLPHGSGKNVRVIVFTENAKAALDAGAEHAGLEDLLQKVESGWTDFDVAMATTSAMKEVRRAARVLGPRGLMPNPKSGTVVDPDAVAQGIQAVKAGRVEFKMDKTGNMGVIVGKRSFGPEKAIENAKAIINAVGKLNPPSYKGNRYISSVTLSSTMSPGVALDASLYSNF